MQKRFTIVATITILFILGASFVTLGRARDATETPGAATVPTSATATPPRPNGLGKADLYFTQPDCAGEGRFSSLDVNISDPQPAYFGTDGVTYLPDGASATDTIAASVLRDDEGCHNYAEPFGLATYAALTLKQ